jgi:hypothetical protein
MILVKTYEEVGEFIQNSFIDNKPIRKIKNLEDLEKISIEDYDVIDIIKFPINHLYNHLLYYDYEVINNIDPFGIDYIL